MQRGRGNEIKSWVGIPRFGNMLVHFQSHKLATLTGLGSLAHFNLYLIAGNQVFCGNPKTPGCDLFYRS